MCPCVHRYLTFSGTSFSRCLVGAIIFLCYSGIFCSGAYICHHIDLAYGTLYLDQFMEHCEALYTITDAITECVCCIRACLLSRAR